MGDDSGGRPRLRTVTGEELLWPRSLRDAIRRAANDRLPPQERHDTLEALYAEVLARAAALAWASGAKEPDETKVPWGARTRAICASVKRPEGPLAEALAAELGARLPLDSPLLACAGALEDRVRANPVRTGLEFLDWIVAYRNVVWAHGHLSSADAYRRDARQLSAAARELPAVLPCLGRFRFARLERVETDAPGNNVHLFELADGELLDDAVALEEPRLKGRTYVLDARHRWWPLAESGPWLEVARCASCNQLRAFTLDGRPSRSPRWIGVAPGCGHPARGLGPGPDGVERVSSTRLTVLDRPAAAAQPLAEERPEGPSGAETRRPQVLPLALGLSLLVPAVLLVLLGGGWLAMRGRGEDPRTASAGQGAAGPPGPAGAPVPACPCAEPRESLPTSPTCDRSALKGRSKEELVGDGAKLVRRADKTKARDPAGSRRLAQEAVGLYRCALALDTESARIWGDIGWALELAGDLDKAAEAYQMAIADEDGHPRLRAAAQFGLGQVRCAQGRPAEALRLIETSLQTETKAGVMRYRRRWRDDIRSGCR